MKLILRAKQAKGSRLTGLSINKSSISLSDKFKNVWGVNTESWFGAFGYDDNLRLSVFLSKKRHDGFFKITTSGGGNGLYIPISRNNRSTMLEYVGRYEIKNTYKNNDIYVFNIEKKQTN